MQRVLDLIDKYHQFTLAEKKETDAKLHNEAIRQADNKLFVELSFINDEILK